MHTFALARRARTHAIRRGRLVEVLEGCRAPPLPLSVVYPSARRVTPRLRALIEVLTGPGAPRRPTIAHAEPGRPHR